MTTGAVIPAPANRVLDRAVFAASLAHGAGAAALLAIASTCGPLGRAMIAIVLGVAMNWCA
ncbi:MAG: hypothetical protein ABIS92_09880, partial [Polyangia bacterium]